MRRSLLLLHFLLTAAVAMAQWRYHIQSYGDVEDFFTQGSTCMMRDGRGYLWIASSKGIYMFDGKTPRKMYIPNEKEGTGSFSDRVLTMLEDRDKKMWLGTKQGLYVFDFQKEQMEEWTAERLPEKPRVAQLLMDSKERIWALINQCVYIIYPKERSLRNVGGMSFHPNCMMVDSQGTVWMAGTDGKLYLYDEGRSRMRSFDLLEGENFAPYVLTLTEMANGIIAVTTANSGVVLFSTRTMKGRRLAMHGDVDERMEAHTATTPDGRHLWIGTEKGILICDVADGSTTAIRQRKNALNSLSDNAVHSFCVTDPNTVWAGTFFGGLNCVSIDPNTFMVAFPEGENSDVNVVREICADARGRLWVGTEDGGLYRYDRDSQSLLPSGIAWGSHPEAFNVQSLMALGDELWVSSMSSGIYVVDVASLQVKRVFRTSGGMSPQYFGGVTLCHRGKDILVGTFAGVFAYSHEDEAFYVIPQLSKGKVHKLYCDRQNRVWAATFDAGLWELLQEPDGEWKAVPTDFDHQCCITVQDDSKGRLWVGTDNKGLMRYDPKERKTYQVQTTRLLGTETVSNIVEDDRGNLWLNTFDGLFRYNPDKDQVAHYSVADGLPSSNLNYAAGYKDKDGTLYIGSYNGLIHFHPAKLDEPKESLVPRFLDLYVGDTRIKPGDDTGILKQTLMLTKEIKLAHDQSSFKIFYATSTYNYGSSIWFRYRLNADEPWVIVEKGLPLQMTDLATGSYRLELQASYDPEVWNGETATLLIQVKPSPWLSVWAILGYLALIALAVWLYMHRWKTNVVEVHQEEVNQLENQKLKEITNAKINFFTTITHEIRTPLSIIRSSVERLTQDYGENKDLGVIERNTHRLYDLVSQLLDFQRIESAHLQLKREPLDVCAIVRNTMVSFSTVADEKHLQPVFHAETKECWIDSDREAITKIVSNLLSNAYQYCQEKVSIELTKQKRWDGKEFLVMRVTNDGILIPPYMVKEIFRPFVLYYGNQETATNRGTGLGLTLSLSLTELLGGKLYYDDKERDYNVFVLELPLESGEPKADTA